MLQPVCNLYILSCSFVPKLFIFLYRTHHLSNTHCDHCVVDLWLSLGYFQTVWLLLSHSLPICFISSNLLYILGTALISLHVFQSEFYAVAREHGKYRKSVQGWIKLPPGLHVEELLVQCGHFVKIKPGPVTEESPNLRVLYLSVSERHPVYTAYWTVSSVS